MITLQENTKQRDSYKEAVRNLAHEYQEKKQYGAKECTSLRYPRDGEMRWEPFQYFPEAHFRKAYDQLRGVYWPELRTDGGYSDIHNGKKQAKVYYWLNPETGSTLYHTGVNDEETIPFFPDEESAMDYLEKRSETGASEQYENMSLYQARTRKVGDAVDVLTDQSGIEEFMTDGGRPESLHQIPNPKPDRVWFWYNPSTDTIVQEEVEPYDVRGVFDSEIDAFQFVEWYAERNGLDDTSHLELYSGDITHEGQGRTYLNEEPSGEENVLPEQADLAAYQHGLEDDDG